ncbi:MAG: class I SAM-dependent methyltransferase [Myxococcales bacterium]|nr:class I SAM-dependent methyltransferase [Myxococcales bacterium]
MSDLKNVFSPLERKHFVVSAQEPVISFAGPAKANLELPVSQLCTAAQMQGPRYDALCELTARTQKTHRKTWEFVYIYRVLEHYGKLASGQRGLGFGCGTEPLPAAFAARGCEVLATDAALEHAVQSGWTNGQHSQSIDDLNRDKLCDDAAFRERVRFEVADMNDIAHRYDGQFDFTWSACAFEHLGSIERGLDFFVNSMRTLRSGGVAVHTTEFNLTSDSVTVDDQNTVLFRRQDIERLCRRLAGLGYEVAPLNLEAGEGALDRHIDVAPYSQDNHLRLLIGRYVTTSIGVIARKP